MQTLRFADPQTVTHYPLEIPAAADWHSFDAGWRCIVPLPDLSTGSIMTPSLSMLGDPDYRYQFSLQIGKRQYPLPEVPVAADAPAHKNPSDRRVRTAIDCFHILKTARQCQLIVDCFCRNKPDHYLLTVSMRTCELDIEPPEKISAMLAVRPPTHSQMLENPRVASRICSPVSTAMVLRAHHRCIDVGSVIRACFDPVSRMYGIWPLAIRAASQHQIIGAVELFSDWEPVLACLEKGLPVVASIRYGRHELPGAAQPASGGHLVVVYGVADGEVLINDPAAPNHGTVSRRCPLLEFSRAWFRYRGAAYILAP